MSPLAEEWNEAVKAAGGSPDLGLFKDIPTLRAFLENGRAAMGENANGKPLSNVKEQDHQVEMRDGHKITVRTYQPQDVPAGALGMVFHGGGWCVGGLANEENLCRLMASKLGMTVANVDYRMGPEWKFPTAHYDCFDATKWVRSLSNLISSSSEQSLNCTTNPLIIIHV